MSFQLSPGINITEIDLTTIVPAVATTDGAIAGVFRWGPVQQTVLVDSEATLLSRFGKPTNLNPETWFTCSSFLAYGNRLNVVRAGDVTGNTTQKSWIGNTTNQVATYNSVSANAALQLANSTVGNTGGVVAGMILSYANNPALPVGATVVSVNATHVTMSAGPTANVSSAQLVFRDNILFSAGALQSDLNYTMYNVLNWANQTVANDAAYGVLEQAGHTFDPAVLYVSRYPGTISNSLRVAVCDTVNQYHSNNTIAPNAQFDTTLSLLTGNVGSNVMTLAVYPANTSNTTQVATANAYAATLQASLTVGDLVEVGNTRIGLQILKTTAVSNLVNSSNVFSFTVNFDDELKLSANVNMTYLNRYWEFWNSTDVTPGQSDYVFNFGNTAANDELHVVVVDDGGQFTGTPGTILEVYKNLSRATDAKAADGTTIYYKNVINQQSKYVWWANDRTTAVSNTAAFITSASGADPLTMSLVGGADGLDETNIAFGTIALGYDLYQSAEDIDISLVLQGKAIGDPVSSYTQLGNYIVDNITTKRLDCVAFLSPHYSDVINNAGNEATSIVDFRNNSRDTSYAVLDSGYKYMYDIYNNLYRWVPLNGDIAGLCVRTDTTNDPWWSPAGLNRGMIKNVVRLAYNPRKADRDILYKNGINPVISSPGLGVYLYGDKTLQEKPSAFDRINVRRLFIVLEKAIATAAKYTLFEFNDDFTRAQFRNMVNPFLRNVKGKRGITDFDVVCDSSNNPPQVIDSNQFVGDIYIKPARSINFIQLNFIAVPTGVAFSEVVNKTGA
jgi:hypothetical protein